MVTAAHVVPVWPAGAQDAHQPRYGEFEVDDEDQYGNDQGQDKRVQYTAKDGWEDGQQEESKRTSQKVKNQAVLCSLTSFLQTKIEWEEAIK